jgi:glycosyltransferase (activator-dependent family)
VRVLFATYPEKTIFQPMVPLAWALRAAGHEVLVASQPSFMDMITQAGLTAVPIGRQHTNSLRRLTQAYPQRAEEERDGLPSPYDAVTQENPDWATMCAGYRNVVDTWHKLNNFPLMAGLVDFARAWKPDLVIWEPHTYAAPLAALASGAAHGRLLWSVDIFGVTRDLFVRGKAGPEDPLADWLGGYARKYGFDFTEELVTGQFSIDPLPDSLRMDVGLHCLPMRYVPYGGPAVVPAWLRTPPERPRVALTLGTSATEIFAGYKVSVQEILTALSDLDIEVVATVAESEQRKLERVPDNARVVSFVPLNDLSPTCSVVINHAGPGTFLSTAIHGVPQLGLPWEFDELELAPRVTRHGAGLMLSGDEVTGERVRDQVLRLLHEPAFGTRAEQLRDEVLAMPAPSRLVGELEQLTTKLR